MLVTEISEYRTARTAVEVFNQGRKGIEQMQKHPALGQIIADMLEAQQETRASIEQVYDLMHALPLADDEDEG